jgi:hypothetical protein
MTSGINIFPQTPTVARASVAHYGGANEKSPKSTCLKIRGSAQIQAIENPELACSLGLPIAL